MQRSASQRQVKKVNLPVVPDIPGINGNCSGFVPPPPFITNSSTARQSTSSYGSWPSYVDNDHSDASNNGAQKRAAIYRCNVENSFNVSFCPKFLSLDNCRLRRNAYALLSSTLLLGSLVFTDVIDCRRHCSSQQFFVLKFELSLHLLSLHL